MKRRVFVDTSGFFAHVSVEDDAHQHIRSIFVQANTERWSLVTTNAVVVETYSLMLNRLRNGRDRAVRFLDTIESGSFCRVERVTEHDEARGSAIVRRHADKTYSLCDAQSFAVMERLGIQEAISTDGHFREYGAFVVLNQQ